ncbi:hypothetical protein Q3G72_019455 [Acer saccharum]|nr:hypothetical protein Q3G72_019455 [Acer saccharum]
MEISLRDQPSQLPISSDDDQPSQLPVPDSVPLPSVHYQQSSDPVSSDDLSLPRANHNKASLPVLVLGMYSRCHQEASFRSGMLSWTWQLILIYLSSLRISFE